MEVMIFSVFGDESADEQKQRVFAVSGVIGTAAEWQSAIEPWVERTGGEEFHAADCEHEKKHDLYRDLAQILTHSNVAGIGISLDLISFKELLPYALPDVGYYQCLSKVMGTHIRMAKQWNERVDANPGCGEPKIELEFTFDHRIESEGNAGYLYSSFMNQPEWEGVILNSKISFETRRNPRIQIADMVARETMKDLDRKIGPKKFPERKSKIALAAENHFKFQELDRDYCLRLQEAVKEQKPEPGYLEWLQQTKRIQNGRPHDNWANRFAYFAWKENQDILGPKRNEE
jgi:hypothetical protein